MGAKVINIILQVKRAGKLADHPGNDLNMIPLVLLSLEIRALPRRFKQ